MASASVHIGTSGWSYKHWKLIYYPERLAATKWLHHYATDFSIAEINTSFYRLPKPLTINKWMAEVPAGFKFCPKMSRYLTQFKKLNDPEEPLQRFFGLFNCMQPVMGPVLVQLPPMLAYHEQKITHFFVLLKTVYSQYQFALEVRHESWLQPEAINLLKTYGIAFVISQSEDHFPYAELVTAKHVYVRFHGPDALYASSYNNRTLHYYANLFLNWKAAGHDVYAFFNNDINGYAINDARRLISMVGD